MEEKDPTTGRQGISAEEKRRDDPNNGGQKNKGFFEHEQTPEQKVKNEENIQISNSEVADEKPILILHQPQPHSKQKKRSSISKDEGDPRNYHYNQEKAKKKSKDSDAYQYREPEPTTQLLSIHSADESEHYKRNVVKAIKKKTVAEVGIVTLTPHDAKLRAEAIRSKITQGQHLARAKSAPLRQHRTHKGKDGDSDEENDGKEERREYASNPDEFLKDGTPMPFWMYEMKKGTEYVVQLHRKYGKTKKHELRHKDKADLADTSLLVSGSNAASKAPSIDSFTLDPGLRYLKPYDRFFLNHKVELRHGICMNKSYNDFHVLNYHGHLIYRVAMEKRCCRYAYTFIDFTGNQTLKLEPSSGLPKYRRSYRIYCPVNMLAGTVVQLLKFFCTDPQFYVTDGNNVKILEFKRIGTKFKVTSSSPGYKPDIIFEFMSNRGQGPMGRITTKLADLKRANFNDFDYYGVHIQDELSCNMKGRIMAAWFIIYLYYYDGKTRKDVHHNLTDAAKTFFEDKKPSVEEIPDKADGAIPY